MMPFFVPMFLHSGDGEFNFRRKEVVKAPFFDASSLADVINTDGAKATLPEHFNCGVEQPLFCFRLSFHEGKIVDWLVKSKFYFFDKLGSKETRARRGDDRFGLWRVQKVNVKRRGLPRTVISINNLYEKKTQYGRAWVDMSICGNAVECFQGKK
jgi:hypothetical protein